MERSRLLGQLSQQMKRLSDRHHAAFVVVNQVSPYGKRGEGFRDVAFIGPEVRGPEVRGTEVR